MRTRTTSRRTTVMPALTLTPYVVCVEIRL